MYKAIDGDKGAKKSAAEFDWKILKVPPAELRHIPFYEWDTAEDRSREILKVSPADFKNLPFEQQRYWVYGHLLFKKNAPLFRALDHLSKEEEEAIEEEFKDEVDKYGALLTNSGTEKGVDKGFDEYPTTDEDEDEDEGEGEGEGEESKVGDGGEEGEEVEGEGEGEGEESKVGDGGEEGEEVEGEGEGEELKVGNGGEEVEDK